MKKILVSVLSVLYIMPAIAAKSDGNKWASAWGVGGALTCQGTTGLGGRDDWEYGRRPVMIAWKIVEHGGYFCETFIRSQRSGILSRPYTSYYSMDNQKCLWLCEDGFYGENCASNKPTKCGEFIKDPKKDKGTLYRVNALGETEQGMGAACSGDTKQGYCKYNLGGDVNIEDYIQMLVNDVYSKCSWGVEHSADTAKCDESQEHDVVLAVEKIEVKNESTNEEYDLNYTFYVRPLNVRAGCVTSYVDGMPVVQWVGSPAKILCADGWRLNSDKTACEIVPKEFDPICDLEKLCATTPRESYKEGMHSISRESEDVINSGCTGDATVFRCASSSQGFKAKNDFECIDCPNPRQGVGKNGVCQTCETGEIYERDAKKCEPAKALSQTAMRVGPNTEDSDKLADQCWIKDSPNEYKSCILNGNTNNNTDADTE